MRPSDARIPGNVANASAKPTSRAVKICSAFLYFSCQRGGGRPARARSKLAKSKPPAAPAEPETAYSKHAQLRSE